MRYVIKCDDCKTKIGETDSLGESAAGGRCDKCRPCCTRDGAGGHEAECPVLKAAAAS